jgi:hypothetical protein
MNKGFGTYSQDHQPQIGDVVTMKDDAFGERPGYHAFGDSIIIDIRDHPKYPSTDKVDNRQVHLARPHLRASKVGCCKGSWALQMEQYSIGFGMFVERYCHYTTGPSGEADNRRDD